MSEVIEFVSKSEQERARLIREARAIYDSVFPPFDPIREQRDKESASQMRTGADARGASAALSPQDPRPDSTAPITVGYQVYGER